MKMIISSNIRKIMVCNAGKVTIPALSEVPHTVAHEQFAAQVVAMTLKELSISQSKAVRLASLFPGGPRVRLEKIVKLEGLS